jgi:kinesin family protein 1
MKRLIDARARGEIDMEAMQFEPVIYTAKQLRLIRKVVDKWRAHRSFSMAETVLSNAVLIKEANIIRCVMQSLQWSRSKSETQQ